MENKIKLLSICIPTNGMVNWILPAIDSIYAQNVDNDLFEVIVTDNGEKDDLCNALKVYTHSNFHYYKTTSQGFTNQIDAFEKCQGLFCKMLNHRSKMLPGSINSLIELVRKYQEKKPIIYCAEGYAKGEKLIECENLDAFVKSMGVWVSWSAGTGAWKDDLKDIRNLEPNRLFPHTTLLFDLRNESEYVIWNERYEIMSSDAGKGGYDIFYAFSVILPDIINKLRSTARITDSTFVSFKKDLFNYIKSIYYDEVVCPTKRAFLIKDIKERVEIYYGTYYYYKMVILSYIKRPFAIVKHFILRLFK